MIPFLCPWLLLAACAGATQVTASQTAQGLRPHRCPDSPAFCDPTTLDTVPIGSVTITTSGELASIDVTGVSGPLLFSLDPGGALKQEPLRPSFGSVSEITELTIYVYATTCAFGSAEFSVGATVSVNPQFSPSFEDTVPTRTYTVSFEGEGECEPEPEPEPGPDECPEGVLFTVTEFPASHWEIARSDLSDGSTLSSMEANEDGIDGANDPEPTHRQNQVEFSATSAVNGATEIWQRYVGLTGTAGSPEAPGPADPAFVYDPAVRGPLVTLQIRLKARSENGRPVAVFSVAYQEQGGVLGRYFGGLFGVGDVWTSHDTGRLTADGFLALDGAPPLDFSAAGAPISFGYVIEFSEAPAAEPIVVYLDDFEVSAFCTPDDS